MFKKIKYLFENTDFDFFFNPKKLPALGLNFG